MEAPVGSLPNGDLLAGFPLNEGLARGIEICRAKPW